jgi:nucleotide-binding universal stress UspA family protein
MPSTGREEIALAETILVCVNGSTSSNRALDWAISRARDRGEAIMLTCVVNHAFSSQVYGRDFDPVINAKSVLRTAVERVRVLSPETSVDCLLSEGSVRRKLIDETWQRSVVVLGTDRCFDLPGPSFGNLPAVVAAHSHCPTVVVPNMAPGHRSGIIVGVDDTHLSRSVLKVAWQEAVAEHQRLTMITAWPSPVASAVEGAPTPEPTVEFLQSRHQLLQHLCREIGQSDDAITLQVQHGEPAQVLIDAARHARLLVVGNRSHHALSSPFLGSVSRDILLNLSSATMVVPSTWSRV